LPLFSVGGNCKILNPDRKFFLFGSHLGNASWLTTNEIWNSKVSFNNWKNGSDWFLGQEMARDTNFVYLNNPLYFYRNHPSQVTKSHFENSEEIGDAWAKLNRDSELNPINKNLGLGLAFPKYLNTTSQSYTEEELLNFEEWTKNLLATEESDLIEIAKPRIAYISYYLWKSYPNLTKISPYIEQIAKMALKQVLNKTFNAALQIK
jgi:hypothetical protein